MEKSTDDTEKKKRKKKEKKKKKSADQWDKSFLTTPSVVLSGPFESVLTAVDLTWCGTRC